MAIELESIDFVVPIHVIHEIYPGGWTQCLRDHAWIIGTRVWYDAHLFRDGSVSRSGIGELLDHWEDLGFAPTTSRGGRPVWNEVCVVEFAGDHLARPCDWLAVDASRRMAHLANHSPGSLAGRRSFDLLTSPRDLAPRSSRPGEAARSRAPRNAGVGPGRR